MSEAEDNTGLLTFGGHLNVLRKMLFRIILVVVVLGSAIFCFKQQTFAIVLAPHRSDFCTFQFIESLIAWFGFDFKFTEYYVLL